MRFAAKFRSRCTVWLLIAPVLLDLALGGRGLCPRCLAGSQARAGRLAGAEGPTPPLGQNCECARHHSALKAIVRSHLESSHGSAAMGAVCEVSLPTTREGDSWDPAGAAERLRRPASAAQHCRQICRFLL
jgi:hypothetical protein